MAESAISLDEGIVMSPLDQVYADYDADPAFNFLRKDATQIVKGEGQANRPDVVFVGEAPGRDEDKLGRPFAGNAGRKFDEFLDTIGVSRSSVYVTNIVKYRPKENRDPTWGEIQASKSYLDRELELLDCDIIVPLGRHALSVFLPNHQLKEAHGRSFEIKYNGRDVYIVPQYHPAVVLYNPRMLETMLNDFNQIGLVLDALGGE